MRVIIGHSSWTEEILMATKWVRRGVFVAAVMFVAGGLAFAYMHYVPRRTPAGQPPLLFLEEGDLKPLEEAFNAHADSTRILVMLSPT